MTASDTRHDVTAYAFGDGLTSTTARTDAWDNGNPVVSGTFTSPSTTVTQNVTYTLANTGGADGTYVVAVLYMDSFGNWCCAGQASPHLNQSAVTASVVVDQTPPSFTVTSATPDPAGAPLGVAQLVTITIVGFDPDHVSNDPHRTLGRLDLCERYADCFSHDVWRIERALGRRIPR
jgi:hypothetical protein